MAPGEIFNPNFLRSCLAVLPTGVMRYVTTNMDTIPKCLMHSLMAMLVCNLFLLISSLSISFLTFLACLLLTIQNVSILLATTPQGQNMAPRLFNPTEFMMGVCLGITIGGTILSFFVCLTFGRIHAYCSHHPDGPDSCGWRAGSLSGVWWWSSCIFWLNLMCCLLLVLGHSDISSQSSSQQYQSLETDEPSLSTLSSSSGFINQYQQQQGQPAAPAFAQPAHHGGYGGGGYNNVPDVVPVDQTQTKSSHPLQPNILSV